MLQPPVPAMEALVPRLVLLMAQHLRLLRRVLRRLVCPCLELVPVSLWSRWACFEAVSREWTYSLMSERHCSGISTAQELISALTPLYPVAGYIVFAMHASCFNKLHNSATRPNLLALIDPSK